LKKDIAFLAIGQAGGNIGKLFEAQRFKVLYVNTSIEDLRTLPDAKHIYHITDGEGSAKDRNRAKELVIADILDLEHVIINTLTEEFIFVIFSAGGGTGSGASPMLMAYLADVMPKQKIGAITILPSNGESVKSLSNAFQCFLELEQLESMSGLFVIDNNRGPDKFLINESFVRLFMDMLRIPGYVDQRGNIDVMDLKEVLSARGCIQITSLPCVQSSTPRIIESFNNGIFAKAEENGIVQCIALSMASEINTESLKKSIGKPVDMFLGYNRDMTICVLSGLSLPFTRVIGIGEQASVEQGAIKKLWNASKSPLSEKNIDLSFNFMKRSDKLKVPKTPDEIFAMFKHK